MEKGIKVKDTRMHKLTGINWYENNEVPVADAMLVLVETDEFSFLTRRKKTGELLYSYKGFAAHGKEINQNLKPIIISKTEKIEEGDKWFNSLTKSICGPASKSDIDQIELAEKHTGNKVCFKILALPEHFSPKHLQAIVDGKLKEGKVAVECENQYHDGDQWHYKIKLNSSNHITLHKFEEKIYTREQVHSFIREFYSSGSDAPSEWFEQNVK